MFRKFLRVRLGPKYYPAMRAGERLTDQQRQVGLLLVQAGVKDVSHLHRIIETAHPGLVDRVTVSRYLYSPPRRLDYTVLSAIAEALNVEIPALVAVISSVSPLARESSYDISGMRRRSDDLVGAAVSG